MLTDLLLALNPTTAEITSLFAGLKKIPSPVLEALLQSLDNGMAKKIADWTVAFIQHLNDLGPDAIDAKTLREAMEPAQGAGDDFFATMDDAKWRGPKLDSAKLAEASNAITKAIKAQNWQEAVWVGVSLSKVLPL